MKIGLRDIEPNIARRIREMLDYMRTMEFQDHHHTHTPERDVLLAARTVLQRTDLPPVLVRFTFSVGVGFLTLLLVAGGINSGTIPGPMVIAAPLLGGLTYWHAWRVNKQERADDLDRSMTSEEVRAACSVINATPSETSYFESISLLLEIGTQLDTQTGKDILSELNVLIAQARQLQVHRDNLRAAINAESADALFAQREDLRTKLSRIADEAARRAMEQSIDLLETRCQAAQTLQPSLERVEAQQEVILQTLVSVQSSLARMKVAPAALTAPDIAVIQSSISEVTGQTQAVEQAVQEVMSVRSG
ncbi:hypothetical protein LBMAG21_01180 [Armatimonadota bacterium]|nr:hypothetical protein LBMAG21_01180 [Armatimonadota bacterium]